MDLSDAIQALTKAVEANTKAVLAAISGPPLPDEPLPAPSPKAEPKAKKAPAPAKPAAIDYETDVKPLALKVAGAQGRDALIALLSEFDCAKATELKAEQYESFIERAKEVLA